MGPRRAAKTVAAQQDRTIARGRGNPKKSRHLRRSDYDGLAGMLSDIVDAPLSGVFASANDFINAVDPNPGYTDHFNLERSDIVRPPREGVGKAVSDLTHWGLNWGVPIAALTAGGVPALAAIPLGAGVGEYAFNPDDPEYQSMVEAFPPELVDQTPLRHLVRHDTDSEFTKRLKQGGTAALFGSIVDVPVAMMPAVPGLAAGTVAYMGLPYAANRLTPVDYGRWDTATLQDAADAGDMDAYVEMLQRGARHKGQPTGGPYFGTGNS